MDDTMADLNLKDIRNFLVEVARQAGSMILDANHKQDFETGTKINCEETSSFLEAIKRAFSLSSAAFN